MAFTLALVGRPNVGKSTLFNRLVGRRLAIVEDTPGVTRDLREGEGRIGHLRFAVLDTAGVETADPESLPGRMRKLTERAVGMADCCLFLFDARAGILPADLEVADLLRRAGADVIAVANKAEGAASFASHEAWSLGFGEPVAVSAEHGEGMGELAAALRPRIEGRGDEEDEAPEERPEGRPLQIAVLGRPNAGKSTLVNAILGEERMLTGPEAGITRDSIGVETEWGGRPIRIFDTAGLRKRARIELNLEKLSVADALRAVRFAEVVVILMDNASAFETQDLRLADLAEREGRAVVLAVSKWDVEPDRGPRLAVLREMTERMLPQLAGAPLVTLSALTGRGLDRLRDAVFAMDAVWNTRVPTAKLNQWLGAKTSQHPPPAPGGRRIRLRYMTQPKARPPTFMISCSNPDDLPDSYRRFLVNGLREDFGLKGAPIRIEFRKADNPFAGRKPKPRSER